MGERRDIGRSPSDSSSPHVSSDIEAAGRVEASRKPNVKRFIVGIVAGLLVLTVGGVWLATSRSDPATARSATTFTSCMRQHGVTLPPGSGGPVAGGVPSGGTANQSGPTGAPGAGAPADPTTQRALKACSSLLPGGSASLGNGAPAGGSGASSSTGG